MDSRCKITKKTFVLSLVIISKCKVIQDFSMQKYLKVGIFQFFPFQPIIINPRPPN